MKKLLLISFLTIATFLSSSDTALAGNSCQYDNTQARVQKDINDPWKKKIELRCGESFNVGSFHNNTGQFATDTKIEISGKELTGNTFYAQATNGQTITLPRYANGTYSVKVTTPGQSGYDCRETARVYVSCDKPQSCQYDSTQARVQKDINDPWKRELTVACNESFNVGSFHDHTGQFATDTKIILTGKSHDGSTIRKELNNGQSTSISEKGRYSVNVITNDQRGGACKATARVRVKC